jgi:ribulose-phosphate 3-epimerase
MLEVPRTHSTSKQQVRIIKFYTIQLTDNHQTEDEEDALSVIKLIHSHNMKAGVAVSPKTPSTAITDAVGQASDMLLVMTVEPGQGGQKFMAQCVPKVSELRARFPEKDIEVDGGVAPSTIGLCADAGSNVIVAGTAIFAAEDPAKVIAELKDTVNTAQAKLAGAKA